jgi:hypothetical protein
VDGAGDLDGDGLDDVVVGAPSSGSENVYLVAGGTTGSVSLGDADLVLTCQQANDLAGTDVAGRADANADGVPDLLIGAAEMGSPYDSGGAAYVVHGLGL